MITKKQPKILAHSHHLLTVYQLAHL